MSIYIHDLLDPAELQKLMEERRIGKQVHPTLPISIYNYTNRAQFMGKWSKAERVCRGLIVEDATGLVIARGPEKFFNYGQVGAPEVTLDTLVRVTTKHDGSLGIFWTYEGKVGIATRGSFTSDQALHASEQILSDEYSEVREEALAASNETWVSEIIYPSNRIVLSYGDDDKLLTLGYVSNDTGKIIRRPSNINLS